MRLFIPSASARRGSLQGKLLGVLPAILLATGCAGAPPLRTSPYVQVVGATELPPPSRDDSSTQLYRIGELDRLVIDVQGFTELTEREFQVDAAGRLSIPIAGSMTVAGTTPDEAERRIADALRAAHVRNPRVSVNIKESLSRFVTVDGQVTQPGNVPVVNQMTLMRAIAAAKGASEFAKLDDVVVFRKVDGQQMAALYNLGAIRRGLYGDPVLYPLDIVVVGNSPARRLFRDIISTAPLLTAPIIAFTR
ncbi:MAG: polysaccharide biosynthesis/export family protein [Novosphingobium sp.]